MRNERNAYVKRVWNTSSLERNLKKINYLFNLKQVLFNRAMKFVFFFFFCWMSYEFCVENFITEILIITAYASKILELWNYYKKLIIPFDNNKCRNMKFHI